MLGVRQAGGQAHAVVGGGGMVRPSQTVPGAPSQRPQGAATRRPLCQGRRPFLREAFAAGPPATCGMRNGASIERLHRRAGLHRRLRK